MKKTFLIVFLLGAQFAGADTNVTTTVQMNLRSFSGVNQSLPVLFVPLTNWLTDGTYVFAGKPILATPSNGVVTVNLAPNAYDVQVQGLAGTKRIYVPLTNTPQNFLTLTTNLNATYTYSPFYPGMVLNYNGIATNLIVENLKIRNGTMAFGALAVAGDTNGTVVWIPNTLPTVVGLTNFSQRLIEWTAAESYQATSAVYDSDGCLVSANVIWPDKSVGVFTRITKNSTWLTVDSYSITHANSGLTVTQMLVSRDGITGVVTNKPALTTDSI